MSLLLHFCFGQHYEAAIELNRLPTSTVLKPFPDHLEQSVQAFHYSPKQLAKRGIDHSAC